MGAGELEQGVSAAASVVAPVVVVTLKYLKGGDGGGLRVGCEATSELALAFGLPGMRVPGMDSEAELPERVAEANETMARAIEAGSFLLAEDGSKVRPAFYFGADPPHPASLPGRWLRQADREALALGVLRAGGYIGGAAEEAATFRDDRGAGPAAGDGPLEVLPGAGDLAAQGATGS